MGDRVSFTDTLYVSNQDHDEKVDTQLSAGRGAGGSSWAGIHLKFGGKQLWLSNIQHSAPNSKLVLYVCTLVSACMPATNFTCRYTRLPRANHISAEHGASQRLNIEPPAYFNRIGIPSIPVSSLFRNTPPSSKPPRPQQTTQMLPGKVTVLKHPIVNSRLADLRQAGTSPKEFRQVSYCSPFRFCRSASTTAFLCVGGAGELFVDLGSFIVGSYTSSRHSRGSMISAPSSPSKPPAISKKSPCPGYVLLPQQLAP